MRTRLIGFPVLVLCLAALLLCGLARADVLFVQPPTGAGTTVTSAYWDPDGSNYDEFIWDAFELPVAGTINEIRWRGGYAGGARNIVSFEVAIYASIPAGTQPDLGFLYPGPLAHFTVDGNAGETPAGTFGGTAMYDYHYTLARPFLAAANTRYWLQIIAWQSSWPTWGLSTATGGNGSHFARVPAAVGDYRYVFGTGDVAFTLVGTTSSCSAPTITLNPAAIVGCANATTAVFSAAATGTGPFSYRWRLNGNAVFDGPNGGGHGGGATISGATTATLTISNASYWADVGTYDCVISNACGPSTTSGATLTVTFGGPTVTSSPTAASSCAGDTFTLLTGAGNGPLSYQWKKDGVALSDGPTANGSIVSGVTAPMLSVVNAQPADQGSYVCVVRNPCSAVTSAAAMVTVNTCTPCPADFNQDGGIDGADVEAFFLVWEAGDAAADVNIDGGVDGGDVATFFIAWEAGGC
ncbi:MAG: immunoglobulin domain-containing protein [Planctomycetes bacterium]|nr:immunoglobulin domain-containing protein [Planctomycetota bacterium]